MNTYIEPIYLKKHYIYLIKSTLKELSIFNKVNIDHYISQILTFIDFLQDFIQFNNPKDYGTEISIPVAIKIEELLEILLTNKDDSDITYYSFDKTRIITQEKDSVIRMLDDIHNTFECVTIASFNN